MYREEKKKSDRFLEIVKIPKWTSRRKIKRMISLRGKWWESGTWKNPISIEKAKLKGGNMAGAVRGTFDGKMKWKKNKSSERSDSGPISTTKKNQKDKTVNVKVTSNDSTEPHWASSDGSVHTSEDRSVPAVKWQNIKIWRFPFHRPWVSPFFS